MADPTPERIEAALALAEALYADCLERGAYDHHTAADDTYNAVVAALRDYVHASKPKLRTRAEVDAEIGKVARIWSGSNRAPDLEWLLRLCREPLAADPSEPNRVTDHDADQRPEKPNHTRVIRPPAYGPSSVDSSSPSEPAAGATYSPTIDQLPSLWESQAATYPANIPLGCGAAAAVRLCAQELRAALASQVAVECDTEACGCEESDALKAEIAVLRAKISDCANHAQSGLGHGKYPSCSAETACRWIYQRLTNP